MGKNDVLEILMFLGKRWHRNVCNLGISLEILKLCSSNLAPVMFITKETKWHQLCRCHDDSIAAELSLHNTETSISIKRKKVLRKEKLHSLLFWKAFQIKSYYFSSHIHFNSSRFHMFSATYIFRSHGDDLYKNCKFKNIRKYWWQSKKLKTASRRQCFHEVIVLSQWSITFLYFCMRVGLCSSSRIFFIFKFISLFEPCFVYW